MKIVSRRFLASSSFSLAVFFTALLGFTVLIIGVFLYDFSQQIPPELYTRFQRLSFVIMAFMFIVILVSFYIAYFVVSRINIIAETAEQIMNTGDLSKRIQITTKMDDLSNLAHILNGFLGRVEVLMVGIRDVSDNIAHDLRTPLSHLRHIIENLKGKTIEESDLDEVLKEADLLLEIFNSLLRIANIEKGKRNSAFKAINLSEITHDVIELYEPIAEEKDIKINFKNEVIIILGDKNLIFQMLANLLSNALKYAPKKSKITFSLNKDKEKMVLMLTDEGDGIPLDEREKVFQRFYRIDKSRTLEGHGLGLSLVKAIIMLHNGEITLEDNQPGLRVVIKIDLAPL